MRTLTLKVENFTTNCFNVLHSHQKGHFAARKNNRKISTEEGHARVFVSI